MDEKEVDPVQPKSLHTVLVGTHDAVVTVVEIEIKRQSAGPELSLEIPRIVRRSQDSTDFCRKYKVISRSLPQKMAESQLALAMPIVWRGIELANTRFPCGL